MPPDDESRIDPELLATAVIVVIGMICGFLWSLTF
jgi:hypothetical protein